MRTGRDDFSGLQRVLHWLMAIVVLIMLFIGVSMVSTLKPRFLTLITIHKPLGIAIFAMAVLRLGVRLRLGATPLPDDLARIQALAAKLSHFVLYALLIAMPLVGWGMLSAGGYPVVLYGSLHLPEILPMTTSCTRSCERRIQCSPTCFSQPSCCTSQQRSSMLLSVGTEYFEPWPGSDLGTSDAWASNLGDRIFGNEVDGRSRHEPRRHATTSAGGAIADL